MTDEARGQGLVLLGDTTSPACVDASCALPAPVAEREPGDDGESGPRRARCARGGAEHVYDADPVALLAREVLRERTPALVAEACAWSVGLSDQRYLVRSGGRLVPSGLTLGMRAEAGLTVAAEDDGRLELGDARPGSFQDALNALDERGRLHAERFDDEVVVPFVLETCVQAAERFRELEPQAWAELLEELAEDGGDVEAVVRAAEWEAPLRTEAEQLALAALADLPLVEVEAEGLPLSLVRAAEAELRRAALPAVGTTGPADDEIAGALFLADVALREAGLELPVRAGHGRVLLRVLREQGLEPEEVRAVLTRLPVHVDAADEVLDALAADEAV